MQFLYNLVLVVHFIGLASLLGGVIVQITSPDKGVNRAILDGALTQLVTGVVLVGISGAGGIDEKMNNSTVGIKLIIVIIVTGLALWGRKKPAPQVAIWAAIGALTLINILVAVFMGVTAA